jgi:CheY-like chemotaxis protein
VSGTPAPPGPRVLIAEDEAHLGTLLELFLAGRGCEVVLARDGSEALARLRAAATAARGFDVAVVDVHMPGTDGIGVLRAARRVPLAPEVVLATGNATVDLVQQALGLGAYDVIAKPYRMAEVELLVRRAAEVRALRRTLAAVRVAQRVGGRVDLDAPGGPTVHVRAAALPAGEQAAWLLDGRPVPEAPSAGAAVPPDDHAALLALADGRLTVEDPERLPPELAQRLRPG